MALHIQQKVKEGLTTDAFGTGSLPTDSFAMPGNDIAALFSYFSGPPQLQPSTGLVYRELVREKAALAAAGRWPLLAEMEGLEPSKLPQAEGA